ncbi:DNA-binding protein [Bifidobacterium sp. UTCIF-39]|uniref:helix-turn-helix transcriptional regulator n=1 Tax=Bifidobacterium sp. UTCIF-39 TaxID=1465359 RepID=UPI00215996B7|nr:helix-turn-helix transcriptional regulator [Bifidobacterium sp. UTCIF-39]TPF96836.1 DNA-binding protein [Bifidobacterium sp. UTCIF-39]
MEHNEPTSAQLGAALKQILCSNNMTQEDLATFAGIPRNTLNRKINGGVFTFDELTRVAHVVKMPLSKIIALAEASALAGKEAE